MTIISASVENENQDAFDVSSDGQLVVIVDQTVVASYKYAAVSFGTFNNVEMDNSGHIVGRVDLGSGNGNVVSNDGTATYIYGGGDSDAIINSGSFHSSGSAIYLTSGSNESIHNAGMIFGYQNGIDVQTNSLTLTNTGSIVGSLQQGVEVQGSNETIRNMGTISGQSFGLSLDCVAGSSSTIINSGQIVGGNDSVYVFGSGSLTFRNTGSLDGSVYEESGISTTFTNAGAVQGDVTLGNAGNIFNGRGGSVDGTITGGSSADTIVAGDDGETINGGAGHDKLYAGAGADTFAFTSYSSPDYDHIAKFNVAQDTIQLDSTVFTHLAADTTPVFSIASAPTSATDLLYYNSSTGGLYYDPDGSGTKYHGYAVAVLDKGLALTASNFSVV